MEEKNKYDLLNLFHHIHHVNGEHIVHHCGGKHVNVNFKLDYNIKHCNCNKHCIDKKKAIGHDFKFKEVLVEFTEKCLEGGWHLESGIILVNQND